MTNPEHSSFGEFRLGDRAYELRDPQLPPLQADPDFDSIRNDPRLKDIVHRINISED